MYHLKQLCDISFNTERDLPLVSKFTCSKITSHKKTDPMIYTFLGLKTLVIQWSFYCENFKKHWQRKNTLKSSFTAHLSEAKYLLLFIAPPEDYFWILAVDFACWDTWLSVCNTLGFYCRKPYLKTQSYQRYAYIV